MVAEHMQVVKSSFSDLKMTTTQTTTKWQLRQTDSYPQQWEMRHEYLHLLNFFYKYGTLDIINGCSSRKTLYFVKEIITFFKYKVVLDCLNIPVPIPRPNIKIK